jgi:hypothetical protein
MSGGSDPYRGILVTEEGDVKNRLFRLCLALGAIGAVVEALGAGRKWG